MFNLMAVVINKQMNKVFYCFDPNFARNISIIAGNIEIPSNARLTLKKGYSLTISQGSSLTISGILNLNGQFTNNGILTVSENGFIENVLNVVNNGTITDYPAVTNGVCNISTPMQLQWISYMVENDNDNIPSNINLLNDIRLPDVAFIPIGNSSFYYNSTFNGNRHTISNIQLNITSEYRGGLFGNVGDVTIKDLSLNGQSTNSTSSYIGALIGYASGFCTVSNVHVTDFTVNSPISYGVGGFVG